ncbi:MAG: bifunctional 23S rRNA (guanine(2069)-N(7))-methyltransferase RlmK/23S rRNA (guanine(2445)-N(2))-methyltransferase RlmL [Pseudomonadota bacterium]
MNMRAVTFTCPGGLEGLLADEVRALGVQVERTGRGAVVGVAEREALYRSCLWSRHANHVLLRITTLADGPADALYARLKDIDWDSWLQPGQRFAISVSGSSEHIANSQHAVFRTKDAIVDWFAGQGLSRPVVDRERPAVQLQLHLDAKESALYLNLNGAPLHERGYRVSTVEAPLKENLAAALVVWAGVGRHAVSGRPAVILDPMCGSGTLLIEAAWVLGDVAPGLLRTEWGFTGWQQHDPRLWEQVRNEALARRARGAGRAVLIGYDSDPRAVRAAQTNIAAAGLSGQIHVERQSLAVLRRTGRLDVANGFVLVNPPYGERLSADDAVPYLYRCLGRRLRATVPGWRVAVLASQVEHLDEFRIAGYEQHRCHNGPLACFARVFTVPAQPEAEWPPFRLREGDVQYPLAAEGEALANRLRKNEKQLRPWLDREGIRAFRLYDADLPEFNVAVDIYGDRIHVQEYAAPSSVDPEKAAHRLDVALDTIAAVTGRNRKALALKIRSKQKGAQQYRRQGDRGDLYEIEEHGARLLVNLTDYLDTGLFLDHRPLRQRLQTLCRDKHFLNLFCYTGAATVHAALAGARSTTSVDLNPRYLAWAEANLALNGFSSAQHHLVRADVMEALRKGGDQFDVIFIDPPTFSNSKRTANVLDIQRDHVDLLRASMRHLARDGLLLFSNNYRRFRLDEGLLAEFDVRDITADTIPPDFARNPKIHQCWEFRHRGGAFRHA